MRIKTQTQPAQFIPKRPEDFIGYAGSVAKVLAAKAATVKDDRHGTLKYILTGEPGIGKTRLAEFFAECLTGENVVDGQSFHVTSINGRMVDMDRLRKWREEGRFIPSCWNVKIINEIDTVAQDKEDALLSYLDELPGKTAVIGTANHKVKELTPRFQSRLQSFHVKPPTEDEIKSLVTRWTRNPNDLRDILLGCGGNVRAALLDTQSILDARLA